MAGMGDLTQLGRFRDHRLAATSEGETPRLKAELFDKVFFDWAG